MILCPRGSLLSPIADTARWSNSSAAEQHLAYLEDIGLIGCEDKRAIAAYKKLAGR